MSVPHWPDSANPAHHEPESFRGRSRLPTTAALEALVTLGLIAAISTVSAGFGYAQIVDEKLWTANGPVHAIVRDGGTIYIGGEFTEVVPASPIGGGAPIDSTAGAVLPNLPQVIGSVYAVVPDGSEGWYIGGSFTSVGGLPRSNLAHVESDLSVSAWSPNADGLVRALAMSGSIVYAGGDFTSIGGAVRNHIAALNVTTGAATAWDANADSVVSTLALGGSTVYAGGGFTSIGGQSRNHITALDATTGAATTWDPSADGGVSALAVSGSIVYVGGDFTNIGGQPRSRIAALDATTGAATEWNPDAVCICRGVTDCVSSIHALAVSGSTVYAGGHFCMIGGQRRINIAALDAATGAAIEWISGVSGPSGTGLTGSVEALAVSGSTAYVGGDFLYGNVAAFAVPGSPLENRWTTATNGIVRALAVSGSAVYVGGDFTNIGQTRVNIAALDATTGAATAWNPGAGPVYALAVSGSTVYAGGSFGGIGGAVRSCIAALDAATGVATDWDPGATPGVYPPQVVTIAVGGSTIYVGGVFGGIGGQTRNNLAEIDAATGAATAWDPNPDGFVTSLELGGSTVYAGGNFTAIGGQTRNHIAALDAASGAATTWDPNADGSVYSMVSSASTVYVGGAFTSIGGESRNHIAALDATTGAATEWNPNSDGPVRVLAVNDSTIYVGGSFSAMGGQTRNHIAALNAGTDAASDWNADADGDVGALAVAGSTVYAGGDFASIGGLPQAHIAAMGDVTTPTLLSLVSAQAEPGSVRLAWFAGDGHVLAAAVYRRTATEGWGVLGRVSVDGTGRLTYEDTRVIAGERYGYRLGVLHGGAEEFLGETWVEVPRAPEFTLSGLRPNPASDGLSVLFSLPDAAPARLELLDIAGRRVLVRDVGTLGRGSHVVPLAEERTIASGVYVLRLSRGGTSLTKRAIVFR